MSILIDAIIETYLYRSQSSLPAPLVNSSPATEKVIHRVVYRAVLPLPSDSQHHVPVHQFLSFEAVLVQPRTDAGSFGDEQLADGLAEETAVSAVYSSPECYMGYETEVDVMLPDRYVGHHCSNGTA